MVNIPVIYMRKLLFDIEVENVILKRLTFINRLTPDGFFKKTLYNSMSKSSTWH